MYWREEGKVAWCKESRAKSSVPLQWTVLQFSVQKKWNNLEDIALTLSIPFTGKTLKADIWKAIQDQFEAHPKLKKTLNFPVSSTVWTSLFKDLHLEASSSSSHGNHMLHAPRNAVAMTPSPYYSSQVPQLNGNFFIMQYILIALIIHFIIPFHKTCRYLDFFE